MGTARRRAVRCGSSAVIWRQNWRGSRRSHRPRRPGSRPDPAHRRAPGVLRAWCDVPSPAQRDRPVRIWGLLTTRCEHGRHPPSAGVSASRAMSAASRVRPPCLRRAPGVSVPRSCHETCGCRRRHLQERMAPLLKVREHSRQPPATSSFGGRWGPCPSRSPRLWRGSSCRSWGLGQCLGGRAWLTSPSGHHQEQPRCALDACV